MNEESLNKQHNFIFIYFIFLFLLLLAWPIYAKHNEELEIIEYLKSIKTFQASFIQGNPGGIPTKGKIYLEPPSRLRLEYYSPKIIITINKELLAYHDVELEETSHTFLEKNNPIFYLITNLSQITIHNSNIRYYKDHIHITRRDQNFLYTIILARNPIAFNALEFQELEGEKTTLKFSNVIYNKALRKKLFTEF